ncbi:MAG TPA: hypothetical protein VK960_08895 [Acidimicrobiia bacterium]|nr:hypothetical protein [Acidimicrobiia bacterium]
MLITTHTMQALGQRLRTTKVSSRKPVEQGDGDRSAAAPSVVLAGRPVPAAR